MDVTNQGVIPAPPDRVLGVVADLGTYPEWLGIVVGAAPDGDDAWLVDLGARVGPLRRTKRVRMARVERSDAGVRFERRERDGREHSPWVLRADVVPQGEAGTQLTMHLHYGGSRWLPGLDLLLREEVRRATGRLTRLLSG